MSEANDETKVVLIVDPASAALGRTLKQLGCEPQSCSDMHAALIAARAERPALVIASAELPDGDGFVLCDRFRAEPTLDGVPVVLLCGESSAARARAHGSSPKRANAYLFGPLSVSAIVQQVGQYLTDGVALVAVDDEEISLNSAVEVVQPGSTKRPPPPKKNAVSAPPPSMRGRGSAEGGTREMKIPRPSDAVKVQPDLQHEVRRLRDELRSVEAKHAAAIARLRAEHEAVVARLNELHANKLSEVEQNIARARDSLVEAMRGVDLARN